MSKTWNMQDRRTFSLSDQLYRAVGSISANISEGYSRSGGKDRAHFYECSLGSARESRGWYVKGRHVQGEHLVEPRIRFATQIIRLRLTMVPDQRNVSLHEAGVPYEGSRDRAVAMADELSILSKDMPTPTIPPPASRLPQAGISHAP